MVKLAIQTADQRKEKSAKQPLDDTVEISLDEQPVVLATQKGFCTGRTACSVVAVVVVLTVGGALLGVYLQNRYSTPRCIDWGPGCLNEGPPIPPVHFHDGPQHGDNEAPSGVSGRKIKGPYSHHGRQSGGHQESSSKEHDRDRYHPRFPEHPGPHHSQRQRYPPGTAGSQGDSDGHQRDSPAL